MFFADKSQKVANNDSQQKRKAKPVGNFEDSRPESVTQESLQNLADNSSQLHQLKAVQAIADNAVLPTQLQMNSAQLTNSSVVQMVDYAKGRGMFSSSSWQGYKEDEFDGFRDEETKNTWQRIHKNYQKLNTGLTSLDGKDLVESEIANVDEARVTREKHEGKTLNWSERSAADTEIAAALKGIKATVTRVKGVEREKATQIRGVRERWEKEETARLDYEKALKAEAEVDGIDYSESTVSRIKEDLRILDLTAIKLARTTSVATAEEWRVKTRAIDQKLKAAKVSESSSEEVSADIDSVEEIAETEASTTPIVVAKKSTGDKQREKKARRAQRSAEAAAAAEVERQKQTAIKATKNLALQQENSTREDELSVFQNSTKADWEVRKTHVTLAGTAELFIQYGSKRRGELHYHVNSDWTYKNDDSDMKIRTQGSSPMLLESIKPLPAGLRDWIKEWLRTKPKK